MCNVQANAESKHVACNPVAPLANNFWCFISSSPAKILRLFDCEMIQMAWFVIIGDACERT